MKARIYVFALGALVLGNLGLATNAQAQAPKIKSTTVQLLSPPTLHIRADVDSQSLQKYYGAGNADGYILSESTSDSETRCFLEAPRNAPYIIRKGIYPFEPQMHVSVSLIGRGFFGKSPARELYIRYRLEPNPGSSIEKLWCTIPLTKHSVEEVDQMSIKDLLNAYSVSFDDLRIRFGPIFEITQ